MKAVVTDYTFGNLDIEKKILEEHNISLSGFQCRSEGEVAQAAADADYVITQFAPVRAEAIAPSVRGNFHARSKRIVSQQGIRPRVNASIMAIV